MTMRLQINRFRAAAAISACVVANMVAWGPAPLAAQSARSRPELTEKWSRVFKLAQTGSLDLRNLAGEVTVTGGPGDEIRVEAVKRIRGRRGNDHGAELESLEIRVNETAGRVEIQTEFPHDGKRSHAEVDFSVQVPQRAAVAIQTVSGNIEMRKVDGEARAESVSGNLDLTDVRQLLRAKTVSGNVTISGSAGDAITAGTVSGELQAKGMKAKGCDLQSVSGNVSLSGALCQRAQLRSISGRVDFDGELAPGGRYEFNSHSGDVHLAIAGSTGFQLMAKTFSGNLDSSLALAGAREREPDQPGMPNRQLRGTVGDGSAYVVVKTFSGSVTLVGRAPAARR